MPIDPPKKPEYGNFRKYTAGGAAGAAWKYNKDSKVITAPGGLRFTSDHPQYANVVKKMTLDYGLKMGQYDEQKAAYDKEMIASNTPVKTRPAKTGTISQTKKKTTPTTPMITKDTSPDPKSSITQVARETTKKETKKKKSDREVATDF